MIGRSIIMASASALAIFASVDQAVAQQTAPADANAAPDAEDEIVVTARKREERLADVPSAIAVIDAQTLENRGGASSALDLLTGQASVRIFNTSSPGNSEISLRGSPTARNTNSDPSIGLYRNGAYIGGGRLGGRTFTRLDLFDVERVELLRGTQGALYGRNAVGGAVNIISQQPVFDTTGFVDYRHGLEPEGDQFQAVVNIPLNEMFAFRLGGEYVDRDDGFFYNPQNDVYFDRESGHSLRGQIRMRTDRLDANLLLEHQRFDLPALYYQIVIPPTPGSATTTGYPVGYTQDPFSYPWSQEPFFKQQVNDALLAVNYDLGWADLVSTTFYRDRKSSLGSDIDTLNSATASQLIAAGIIDPPGAATTIDTNVNSFQFDVTESLIQDVHVGGTAFGDRLDWLFGAEYVYQESDANVVGTRTPTGANPSPGTRSPALSEYESAAAYGSVSYDVTEWFNVTGEARYTADRRSVTSRRFDLGTGLPSGGTSFNVDGEATPDNISYNLTASIDIGPALVYAKIGSAYRAGGFNADLGIPAQPVPIPIGYDDETSLVYEVGIKGDLAEGLYSAFSVYQTEADNLIVQLSNGCTPAICGQIARTFLDNAGAGEIWGVEFETVYRTEFLGGNTRLSFAASRQGGEVTEGSFMGATLAQIPDWIASADVYYQRPFVGGTQVFGSVQYNAQWGGVQELSTTSQTDVADRQLFNVRGGVRIPNGLGSLELSAFVNNATDEIFPVFESGTARRLSTPRTYGVGIRQRW